MDTTVIGQNLSVAADNIKRASGKSMSLEAAGSFTNAEIALAQSQILLGIHDQLKRIANALERSNRKA